MQEFKNLNEVLESIESVFVIDLLHHALSLEEQPYLGALVEPEEGLYLPGSIDPILRKRVKYYFRSDYAKGITIKTFDNIFDRKEDILDDNGVIVISQNHLRLKKKYITEQPTIPSVAIKVAISVALKFLNGLSRYTNINISPYHLHRFIKPEFSELIEREEYDHAYEELLDELSDFVGKDTWNMYFFKIRGTNLIIEKSVDYRIYKFYEQLFVDQSDDES